MGISSYYKIDLFGSFLTKNQIDMSDINFIITKKEDLKSLIYQWLDEHPHFFFKEEEKEKPEPEIPEPEKPMNRKEIAEYLGVSPVTVTDWMKKGLHYRRIQGRVFFMKDEVMASMSSFNQRKNSFIKNS
jgi:hypothetical protein